MHKAQSLSSPVSPKAYWSLCLPGDLLAQVGTTPYVSKFTGNVEQLPAAAGFIAARGSDIMLADFVKKMFDDIGYDIKPAATIIGQSSDEL